MCTRDTSYQNRNGKEPVTNMSIYKRNNNILTSCKYRGFYPSFTPVINFLSKTTSVASTYAEVQINGSNFLPPSNATIYVNFGSFTNLPITFYSSFNISFVVPLNAVPGSYNVTVVNVYNSNFSPQINQTNPGNLNYSNSITYTIT